MIKVMKNLERCKTKQVKVGFSWTTFFFGGIPSFIRGDFISALKIFFLNLVTFRIYGAWKAFNVNQDYENLLVSKGYREIETINSNSISMPIIEYFAVALTTVAPIIIVIFIVAFEINVFNILDPILNSGLLSKIPVIKEFVIEDDSVSKKESIVSSSQKEENENIKEGDDSISTANSDKEQKKDELEQNIHDVEEEKNSNSQNESGSDFEDKNSNLIDEKEMTREEWDELYHNMLKSNVVEENHAKFNPNRALEDFESELKKIEEFSDFLWEAYYKSTDYNPNFWGETRNVAKKFELYDKELNYIWKYLEKTLPKSRMESLRAEQIEWINLKEATKKKNLEAMFPEGNNGDGQYNSWERGEPETTEMTKERCYYLLQYVD